MLHRAASNAYSWWWASHIRTKQSKWLEHNLEEMEEKVKLMLQIIDEDGDSFAKRAEMYYKRRPELLCFVEDAYRAYRALAERYDHLSRELQNANRTMATVFPEQVQFAMDEDGENQTPQAASDSSSPSKPKVVPPAVPKSGFPTLPMLSGKAFHRRQLKRQEASITTIPSSGLSKSEALEEIDKLLKGILALQTEKEFLKSSYEAGLAKYWELEKQITEMQAKVCRLQDEFGIQTIIEDDDARNLMAATALSSCQDTLAQLQEKHEQWTDEARAEYQKIKAAQEKLKARKNDHLFDKGEDRQQDDPSSTELEMQEDRDRSLGLELLQHNQKIKEQFELNSGLRFNMTELADKIDELVNKVINLESAVCSHTALVERLILETGRLQAHIQSVEDDDGTENLGMDSEDVKNKLKELEKELQKVKELSQSIEDKTCRIQMEFMGANYNLVYLKEKLQTVKPDDEVENGGLFQEGVNVNKSGGHDGDVLDGSGNVSHMRVEGVGGDYAPSLASSDDIEVESMVVQSELNPQSSSLDSLRGEENAKQDHNDFEIDQAQEVGEKVEDLPKWRQLLSSEQFDEREKILVEEYTAILHDYREAKKKLCDAEKKNRDSFLELAMQIKELRNENASKTIEIQSLHHNLRVMQSKPDEEGSAFNALGEPDVQSTTMDQRIETPSPGITFTPEGDEEKPTHINENHSFSAIEEKFRSDIDSLLDENLGLWLRFSNSFHQIQKFQTSIQDLKGEVSKLNRQLGSGSIKLQHQIRKSDARPIYKHLREIQTELTLWTEQNGLLKDDLQSRLLNLNSIHDDIVMVSNANAGSCGKREEQQALDQYLAAKFQGEVLIMKQENQKISEELTAGLVRVRGLEVDIQRTLARMEDDFGLPPRKLQGFQHANKQSTMQRRVPLRSFLFGKKKKHKPSIFSCMSPAFQKHFSDMNHSPGFGFPT